MSDVHRIVHVRADSLCCHHQCFFSFNLFSPFCLSESNYVCIRLSTGLFLCKTMAIFFFFFLFPGHVHCAIVTVVLRSEATGILQTWSCVLGDFYLPFEDGKRGR